MAKVKTDLDLPKLEIYYWVAELRSFSLAAARLSLTQPTVSAHIRDLEDKLGSKLLNRVGREVTPTALGQVLLERAKALLSLKRETLAALNQFQGKVQGELLIGGSTIPGEYVLPGKLGVFVQSYPEVKPILRIGDSAEIVQAVLDGEVELGFIGFKGGDGRLSSHKIWRDEMVLAVPKGHLWSRLKSVNLYDLKQARFISREGGSGTLRSFRSLLSGKRQEPEKLLNVIMELGSTEAVKQALIAGIGISILSRTAIQREVQDGLLKAIPIRGLKLERDFYLIFHRHRTLSPVSQAFIQFLKHH
ncbi:MAG: selenium metabolism-associated LysR family transcriptional regulator [Candidatus Binatia bacterium]